MTGCVGLLRRKQLSIDKGSIKYIGKETFLRDKKVERVMPRVSYDRKLILESVQRE